MQPYSWIFVDSLSQETFRIRLDDPAWEAPKEGTWEGAKASFEITSDDGSKFDFLVHVGGDVLKHQEIEDLDGFIDFLGSQGVDIVEKAIHRGLRDDSQLMWSTEGVTLAG